MNASLNLRAARGIVIGAVVISAALMSWQVYWVMPSALNSSLRWAYERLSTTGVAATTFWGSIAGLVTALTAWIAWNFIPETGRRAAHVRVPTSRVMRTSMLCGGIAVLSLTPAWVSMDVAVQNAGHNTLYPIESIPGWILLGGLAAVAIGVLWQVLDLARDRQGGTHR